MAARSPPLSADTPEVQELMRKFVADLKSAQEEGLPFSVTSGRPVLRIVSLDPVIQAAANDDVQGARVALAQGGNPNEPDEEGWTPLHHASHYGNLAVLRLLLTHRRANVHAQSKMGWRPLDVACNVDCARALLDAGATATPALAPGALSPLHHAVYHSRDDVVALLLSLGARVSDTFSAEAARASFGDNFPNGGTVLHMAAVALNASRGFLQAHGGAAMAPILAPELARAHDSAKRRASIVTQLIAAGADVHATSPPAPPAATGNLEAALKCSQTALMLAAQAGDAAVIRALLAGGARVGDAHRELGHTALHYAAAAGHADVIHALVAGGADVNSSVSGMAGGSALMFAMCASRTAAVRALLNLGADSADAAEVANKGVVKAMINEPTLALVLRHHANGGVTPARVCALPECEARRRADYDDKGLLACAACRSAVYCCKEHQRAHWPLHKALCKKAARKAAAP